MANQKLVVYRAPQADVPPRWGEVRELRVGSRDLPIEGQIGRGRVVSHHVTPLSDGELLISVWVVDE